MGLEGAYALAHVNGIAGTVYIPLNSDGWESEMKAVEKMRVVISGVYQTERGWRANSARPYGPEDAQPEPQQLAMT
jgi:hypothetical protein